MSQTSTINTGQQVDYKTELSFSTFNAYTLPQVVSSVLKEAYIKLGISTSISYLPGNRSLLYSSTGRVDGELFRIGGIQKKFPKLIQVMEPILELQTIAYSSNVEFKINGWESLSPYKLGFLRSFKKADKNTIGMDTVQDDSLSNLFKLLSKDRIDLVIESQIGASVILQLENTPEVKALSPPVDRFYIYHYLHEKNKDLLLPITAVLSQMRLSGETQQIMDSTVRELSKAK
jgi:polar amino acid transport system substrate-binding protein